MPTLPDHNALGIASEQTIGELSVTKDMMTGSAIDIYFLKIHALQIMS